MRVYDTVDDKCLLREPESILISLLYGKLDKVDVKGLNVCHILLLDQAVELYKEPPTFILRLGSP